MWWGKENPNQQTGKISTEENQGKYITKRPDRRKKRSQICSIFPFTLSSPGFLKSIISWRMNEGKLTRFGKSIGRPVVSEMDSKLH
jgi:hypothetical protein